MRDLDAIKRAEIFAGLSEKELAVVLRKTKAMEYKTEGVIVKEKERGGTMHILVEGSVEVRKKMAGGKDKPLAVLAEGDVFGEMSLFDERPYSASVVARENSSTLTIAGKDFLELAETEPKLVMKVSVNLINTLAERLRKTNDNLVAIAALRTIPLAE